MTIPPLSLDGRTALVTGASSGIGRSAAKLLSHCGARVALLARQSDDLEQICHELTSQGASVLKLEADVSSPLDMEKGIATIRDSWGRLDVVVANAGINGVWAPLEEIEPQEWDRTIEVNLRGTYLTVKNTIPLLKKQGGSIIVVASVNGTRIFSNTGATAYSCSKAAQVAFTKMVALELAPHRVRINVVCPGAIETRIESSTINRDLEKVRIPVDFPEGQIPLTNGQPGTAGEVAQLIWFLASDISNHITGTEIYIDGAQSLLQG